MAEYEGEAAAYDEFIARHRLQLSNIPEKLHPELFTKVTSEIFDAAGYYMLQKTGSLRGGFDLVLIVGKLEAESALSLSDHAWTFTPTVQLRDELVGNLLLLERLEFMMGLPPIEEPEEETDDEPEDAQDLIMLVSTHARVSEEEARDVLKKADWEVVNALSSLEHPEEDDGGMDSLHQQIAQQLSINGGEERKPDVKDRAQRVFDSIWKYAQTYSVAWATSDNTVNVQTVWFMCDELGSAITHSETPNSKMITFLYYKPDSTVGIPYSVFWLTDDLEYGDVITRDFVPELIPKGLSRVAYRIALDIYPQNDVEGTQQMLRMELARYKSEVPSRKPKELGTVSALPADRPLRIYEAATQSTASESLGDIQIVGSQGEADIDVGLDATMDSTLLDFGLLAQAVHKTHGAVTWFPAVYCLDESALHLIVADFINRPKDQNWWTMRTADRLDAPQFTTDSLPRIVRQTDLGGRVVAVEWTTDSEVYGSSPFNVSFSFAIVSEKSSLAVFLDIDNFDVRISAPTTSFIDHPASEPTPTLIRDSHGVTHPTPQIFLKNFESTRWSMVLDEVSDAIRGIVQSVASDGAISEGRTCGFYQMQVRIKKSKGVVVEGLRRAGVQNWLSWRSL
ncbi:hypothetical protein SmJEL517_g02023 [Synchytrium microbalum]|uniref:Tubulin--tyrosine ligase-like protein 12 SET-like domain-containing protein n=1 Tax=Synchytrium microbalum TaxID=1806994 RepID=A0A507CCU4_9FUNG|nr:uncharacterized protein SmJEL517_g02023 [Synchytrium microbalum]TPX35744.1 hypothetical protein SmJEL517_g02023 [Synchytrium microbalum]